MTRFINSDGSGIARAECVITMLNENDEVIRYQRNMTEMGDGMYWYYPNTNIGNYTADMECSREINASYTLYGYANQTVEVVRGFYYNPVEVGQLVSEYTTIDEAILEAAQNIPETEEYGYLQQMFDYAHNLATNNDAYRFISHYAQMLTEKGTAFFDEVFGFVLFVVEAVVFIIVVVANFYAVGVIVFLMLVQTAFLIYAFTHSKSALDGFVTYIRLQATFVVASFNLIRWAWNAMLEFLTFMFRFLEFIPKLITTVLGFVR